VGQFGACLDGAQLIEDRCRIHECGLEAQRCSARKASAGRNGSSIPITPSARPSCRTVLMTPSAAGIVPRTASTLWEIQGTADQSVRAPPLGTQKRLLHARGHPTNGRYCVRPIRVALAWKW
jgi:hypothetical protein